MLSLKKALGFFYSRFVTSLAENKKFRSNINIQLQKIEIESKQMLSL